MANTVEIQKRYTELANTDCCISCGGAINYTEIKAGEVCVDLGSGRGTDVIRMAEQTGETGYAYGMDITDEMIEKAKKNAEKLSVNNVSFLKGELESLPIEDKFVDLVISNCTLNHAKDKAKTWSEIHRILKPGGRFVVSDIYATQAVPEEYSTNPAYVAECWGGSITKEEYLNIINNLGFKNFTIIEESKPYSKGKIEVCSFTIAAIKKSDCGCHSNK